MTGAAATIRTLLRTADLTVGEFVCPPGDWRWRSDTNANGTIDYLVPAASLDTVYLIDGGTPGG